MAEPTQLALLADVHGNLEALEAVLEHVDTQAPDAIIVCAGDVVGYGPDPEACFDLLQSRSAIWVRGNHEDMVLGWNDFSRCIYAGIYAATWTRRKLRPSTLTALAQMPLWARVTRDVVICHGDLESTETYITDTGHANRALEQLRIVEPDSRVLISGHTHHAVFFSPEQGFRRIEEVETIAFGPDERCYINPGAVGQSRDGSRHAAYALLDLGRSCIDYQRVPYAHARTETKMRRAGLVGGVDLQPPRGRARRFEKVRTRLLRPLARALVRPTADAHPPVSFSHLPLKQRVLQKVQRTLPRLPASDIAARLNLRRGTMILTYHGVTTAADKHWVDPRFSVSVAEFDRHMAFLKSERTVISLDAMLDALERSEPTPPNTVVITFDDGYLSSLEVALPILRQYALPATIFLPTRLIDQGQAPADELYSLFNFRTRNVIRHAALGREALELRTTRIVRDAYLTLAELLCDLGWQDRDALLHEMAAQLRPDRRVPRLTMDWNEVRRMQALYPEMTIGAHSRNHVDMSRLNRAEAEREIGDSIADIERELGVAPRHFSYPYGRSSEVSRAAAAAAGLRSAAIMGPPDVASLGTDVFCLPRIDAPREVDAMRFYTSRSAAGLSLAVLGKL